MVPGANSVANPALVQHLLQVMGQAQREALDAAIQTTEIYKQREQTARNAIIEQAAEIAALRARVLLLEGQRDQQAATHQAQAAVLRQQLVQSQQAHTNKVATLRTKHAQQFQGVGQKIAAIETKLRGKLAGKYGELILDYNYVPTGNPRQPYTVTQQDSISQNFQEVRQLCKKTI